MVFTSAELVWFWVGFGVAAGLVAMILPFRRGAQGVATNLSLGVLGALLGGVVGRTLYTSHFHDPNRLALSAVFALLTLGIFHVLWQRSKPREPRT